jgi:cell fate regulator YaaT (PSP1 superfamily)
MVVIFRLLVSKIQDEVKALQLCQSKVRAKKLPMEVIDAEYQWWVPVHTLISLCMFFLTVPGF